MTRPSPLVPHILVALGVAGCGGAQSALAPGGEEAAAIGALFWTVTVLGAAITALVTTLAAVALRGPERWRRRLAQERVVLWGGLVLPLVVLSLLLGYGLLVMRAGAARSLEAAGPGISVTGRLWWWRVAYDTPSGAKIVSANELRLPVGRPIALRLRSDDVIHSFWVPRLGGKLDMVPGRTNVLTVEATRPGISRGQCAEYCGGAHALMAFHVIALPAPEFAAWLRHEASPSRAPATEIERRGLELFLANGCGACHAVRGTKARGTIGPDLTHVGARHSLAAATLKNDAAAFARWIAENQHIKPGNLMPPFGHFTTAELAALAAYLDSLE